MKPSLNKQASPPGTSRRGILKSSLIGGTAPLVLPANIFGEQAPSKRISLGFIGTGSHGTDVNLKSFLQLPETVVRTVYDVQHNRMDAAQKLTHETYGNTDCKTAEHFMEIIHSPEIDAVVISTPDHWHVPLTMAALRANKHVFCEKPTLTIAQGRAQADLAAKSGLVFQTGLEDRSLIHYHKLLEIVLNGGIGDLELIDVILPPGHNYPRTDPAPVPDGFNYELWLGPAPWRPYTPTHTLKWHWRQIRDYSGGMLADWGTHLVDTAMLGANAPEVVPIEVKGRGTMIDGIEGDAFMKYSLDYRFSNGIRMRVRTPGEAENARITAKESISFEGSKGWIGIKGWRGQFVASAPEIIRQKYDPATSKHFARPVREHPDFINAITKGTAPAYPAETLHQLSTTLHIGNIAMELGETLNWNPAAEAFIGKPAANQRRSRAARDWSKT